MSAEVSNGPRLAVVPQSKVSDVITARNEALRLIAEAAAAITRGHELAEQARAMAHRAHGAAMFHQRERDKDDAYKRLFLHFDAAASVDVFRQNHDARIWMHLIDFVGINQLMDRTARDGLYQDLCGNVPEVSEASIESILGALTQDAELIFGRGLARVFSELDRRFRSHDGFKVGSRVVLTRFFDDWGGVSWTSREPETLVDIERTFAVLDRSTPDGFGLVGTIRRNRERGHGPRQSVTETPYFRIKGYKNGNAHLWMLRDDLVDEVNRCLARYYGEVLPDGVARDETQDDIADLRTSGLPSKDLAFYPTPPAVVEQLLQRLYGRSARVLEPSAGDGAIVRGLLGSEYVGGVVAVEIDHRRAEALRELQRSAGKRLEVIEGNFLRLAPAPEFDAVVMNPPFYGTHWMEHIVHALAFLKPGGALISVVPATAYTRDTAQHVAFRAWADRHADGFSRGADGAARFYDLPGESFASSGTRINTAILRLRA